MISKMTFVSYTIVSDSKVHCERATDIRTAEERCGGNESGTSNHKYHCKKTIHLWVGTIG